MNPLTTDMHQDASFKRNLASWGFVTVALIFINILFFHKHYLGSVTFPWDFVGGYHAMAYAWLRDGSFINPPLWTPYGNFGFPTNLAVQNSSFYIPLVFIDLLGIKYTLHVATVVQIIHILAGSLGIYYTLRLNRLGVIASLTGAIFFQLSVGFYSNAEHVDIVRGYAITPFVLIALSSKFNNNYRKAAISSWILHLFFTGAYPGIIVAISYVISIYIFWEMRQLPDRGKRILYIKYISVTFLLAVMLSCMKYLPLAVQLDELFTVSNGKSHGISFLNYLTAFFRFDLDFISLDITMRSYYLAPAVFLLLFYSKLTGVLWKPWFVILIISLLLVTHGPIRQFALTLPGMSISRFHVSDFRGIIHIAFIILASTSLNDLLSSNYSRGSLFVRGVLSLGFIVFVVICALYNGYELQTIKKELLAIIITISTIILASPHLSSSTKIRNITISCLWFLSVVSTYIYISHKPITWNFKDYETSLERRIFHLNIEEITSSIKTSWDYRPERVSIKGKVAGNIGYYTQQFSQSGYDNGRRLHRTLGLQKVLKDDKNSALIEFMKQKSMYILLDELPKEFSELNYEQHGQISMHEYGISHIEYDFKLEKDSWLLENEIYYPGWKSEICSNGECREGPSASAALNYLRSWYLPKGEYRILTYYQPPLWKVSQFIFWLALTISIAILYKPTRNQASATPIKHS